MPSLSSFQHKNMERIFLDAYYRLEREHWWFQVRENIIIEQLHRISDKKHSLNILNVGAATGRSTEILQPFGTVASLEYDIPSYEFCRDQLKMDIVNGSILDLPYADASFDLVCAFDVVEHVDDHQKAIQELRRVCKPGGKIFITVPAFMSLWSTHDLVNQHFRRYTKDQLLELFPTAAGRCIRKTYFNSLLFIPVWMVRRIQYLLFRSKKQEELKPDNEWSGGGLISKILYTIFDIDRFLLRKMDLPFGVSFMFIWEKH